MMNFLRIQYRLFPLIGLLVLFGLISLQTVQANSVLLTNETAYLNADTREVRVSGQVSLHPRPNTQYGTIDIILEDTNARIAHLSAAIARHAQFTLPHSDQYQYQFNTHTGRIDIHHGRSLILSLPVNHRGFSPPVRIGSGDYTAIQVGQNGQIAANTLPVAETIQPEPEPVLAVENLTAHAGNQSVRLTWETASGVTHHVLYYGTDPNIHPHVNNSFTHWVVLGSVTEHNVVGLSNNVAYYFVLVSLYDDLESEPSIVVNATPQGDDSAVQLIKGRYLPSGDGSIIRDITTNLEWQRCSVGQTWNAARQTCDGEAGTFNWNDAVRLTASGEFRLPDITELRSLIYCSTTEPHEFGMEDDWTYCDGEYQRPTIVEQAFPNTPWIDLSNSGLEDWFWSSTPSAAHDNAAWFVSFMFGFVGINHDYKEYRVRLVRALQTTDEPLIAERYQPVGNGSIIRDTVNNLEWQRCAVGQTWNATRRSCDGQASVFGRSSAQELTAPGGFRVPTRHELSTLIYCSDTREFGQDCSSSGSYTRPTIMAEAFPNTPSARSWSSSTYTWMINVSYWYVDFEVGKTDRVDSWTMMLYPGSFFYPVRLVRDIQH